MSPFLDVKARIRGKWELECRRPAGKTFENMTAVSFCTDDSGSLFRTPWSKIKDVYRTTKRRECFKRKDRCKLPLIYMYDLCFSNSITSNK